MGKDEYFFGDLRFKKYFFLDIQRSEMVYIDPKNQKNVSIQRKFKSGKPQSSSKKLTNSTLYDSIKV